MLPPQIILSVLSIALTTSACSDIKKFSNKNSLKPSIAMEIPVMQIDDVIPHFETFYRNTVLNLPGLEKDRKFVADLIASPQLEPSVTMITGQTLAIQLLNSMGATNLEKLILFGRLDQLTNGNNCWYIQYQGLLSGGVSACLDKSSGEYLLIWLTSEG